MMVWLMAATGLVLAAVVIGMYRRFWRRSETSWGMCADCHPRGTPPASPQERQRRRQASRTASQAAARDYVRRLQVGSSAADATTVVADQEQEQS